VLNWLKNPDYGFSDEVPNDDLAATIQHALEATWGKIERTEGNKKEKPVLKLLRKDGLTE
jgi:hypothetical protein